MTTTTRNTPLNHRTVGKWLVLDDDMSAEVIRHRIDGTAGLRVAGHAGLRLVRPLKNVRREGVNLTIHAHVRAGSIAVSAPKGARHAPALTLGRAAERSLTFHAPGPSDQIVITVLDDDTDVDIAVVAAPALDRDDTQAGNPKRKGQEPGRDKNDEPRMTQSNDNTSEHDPENAAHSAADGGGRAQDGDRQLETGQAVDVFRLASLRAPAPVSESTGYIELDPPDNESGTHDGTCVDDNGGIQDPSVLRDGYDLIRVPMAELNDLLLGRDDQIGSPELHEWLSTNLLGTLGDVVGSPDWNSYRLRLHSQIQIGLGVGGGTRDDNVAWIAGLLRTVHLAALLEKLSEADGDPDADRPVGSSRAARPDPDPALLAVGAPVEPLVATAPDRRLEDRPYGQGAVRARQHRPH